MRYTYYPGCSLHSTAAEYDLSTRSVLQALGIEVSELADWNCCGASSGHAQNHYLAYALPLRNLILAEREGREVLVPCAACYNLLKKTDVFLRDAGPEAQQLNAQVGQVVGGSYGGGVQVRHVLEVFSQKAVLGQLKERAAGALQGLRLAPYYGCLLTRPPKEVSFEDNPEQPRKLDQVLEALGAESMPWTGKTDCCGASLAISRPELVATMVQKLVDAAHYAGAQALVTACPLCQSNLDTRQVTGESNGGIPVFFVTEIIGLALGLKDSEAWLRRHLVDPLPLVKGRNLAAVSQG